MSLMPLLLVANALLAQPQPGPPPVPVSVVAVQATREGGAKQFGPGLEAVQHAIEGTGFDHYRKVSATTLEAPFERESSAGLGAGYTLSITPLSRERTGHARMHLRLRMEAGSQKGQTINAVDTTITIAPGGQFVLRGLRMDKGELIVVISLDKR